MDPSLDPLRQRFFANPDDSQAFEALEEALFLAGEWDDVIAACRVRLSAESLAENPRELAELQLRIGQIHQDQRDDLEQAIDCYREALRIHSSFRPALMRLRAIHTEREQWDIALQIGEAEAALPQRSEEKGRLLAEMGGIWLDQLGDPEQALTWFERALAERSNQIDAREGTARSLEALGQADRAAAEWDRAIEHLRGPARAGALVARARLSAGPLNQPQHAAELYRRALTDDPNHLEAIESGAAEATAQGKWELLADLHERRFELTKEPARRASIAFEAAELQREKLDNPNAAQLWFERAAQLDPGNAKTHVALSDLARDRGDNAALLEQLERAAELTDGPPPVSTLLELAALHSEAGNLQRACEELELAFRRAPDDLMVAEALSGILMRLGRHEERVEILEQCATLAGSDLAQRACVLQELASAYEEQLGDLEMACHSLQRAFEADPTRSGVVSSLERLYRKKEDWDSLRTFLESAGRCAPDSQRVESLCSLAALLRDHFSEPEEVSRALNSVLEIQPDSRVAHRGLQQLALESGDPEQVRHAYEGEANVSTDPARLAALASELIPRLESDDQLSSALAWTTRWVELAPEDTEALTPYAHLLEQLGRESELVTVLQRLDSQLPRDQQAANCQRLGDVHARAERTDEAIAAYQRALATAPDRVDVLGALSRQLEIAGRLEELANVQRQLADQLPAPDRAQCLNTLARLFSDRLGDLESAIAILERLCVDPNAPDDVDDRFEKLLERAAQFEKLADRLGARAAALAPDNSERSALLLRRGNVLIDHLDRFDESAATFRQVLTREPQSTEARDGLEKSLRAAGNTEELTAFLAEQMEFATDPAARDLAALECACLLQENPDAITEARELFRGLCASGCDEAVREQASERLENLFERTQDWEGLREHLEASLGDDESESSLADLERLGYLYRDRLRNRPRAVDRFESATTIAPERADLWRILSGLYEEEGRIDDFVMAMEAEIATAPVPARELTLRARAAELCVHPLVDHDRAYEHYERIIDLDPTHSVATDFLVDYWARKGDSAAVVRILEGQLAAFEQAAGQEHDEPTLRASLRVRISELRANQLDDLEGAIETLKPALESIGPQPFVTEPLADLYERTSHHEDLIDLCRRAAATCNEISERAHWFVRLGAALQESHLYREATEAYCSALTDQPDNCDARAALRELYRCLNEFESLAQLLELELSHHSGLEEIPFRIELAQIQETKTERPREALNHLRRVLQLDPDHSQSLDAALRLAEQLDRDEGTTDSCEVVLELLDATLRQPQPPLLRAATLARRGRLLEQTLERPDEAIATYRESISLDPDQSETLDRLRSVLESQDQWEAVLDCAYQQAHRADGERRAVIFEKAVEIAGGQLGSEAMLPWLERLREERPNDGTICSRIADIHRSAGRHEATLRAIESQAALVDDPDLKRDLHLECARILEEELGHPARASTALIAARSATPSDIQVLRRLAGIFQKLGRERERAEVCESLVTTVDGDELVALLREIAGIYSETLAEPQRAAAHLLAAVAAVPARRQPGGDLLRELGDALKKTGDTNSWASCAEQELHSLDPNESVFQDRRHALHRELAYAYEKKLGRSDLALHHLRALADCGVDLIPEGASHTAENNTLLRLLRVHGNWVELEQRLSSHLERMPTDPEGWLELARLREERLHAVTGAVDAYRQIIRLEPTHLTALRSWRGAAERLGNWKDVAQTLEHELEHAPPEEPTDRAILLRCLGDVSWRRLESTTCASRSYAAAIEADPGDFESLRSLQQLLETMEDWRGALDLYESEREMLGETDSERRCAVSLRAGELARDHTGEERRAIRNFEAAAESAPLPPARLRELANLYELIGESEAFARTLEQWCDHADSTACCTDHLKLAETLEELGRTEAAEMRIERAIQLDGQHGGAWDMAARLRESTGDREGAACALRHAAALSADPSACTRLLQAAELTAETAPEDAAESLRTALQRDPGAALAHARLAELAYKIGQFDEAERAAGHALDLVSESGSLDSDQQLATALAGGHAARELDHHEAAIRCFAAALELSPHHPDALAQYGETLAASGDLANAKQAFETLLLQDGPNPARPAQRVTVGRALWEAGEPREAVERFEAALSEDPELDEAHECLVSLWEAEGDLAEGIACLDRWADIAPTPVDRAKRLLRAAEWELRDGNQTRAAERHLRDALEADLSQLRPWEALTSLLWDDGRCEQALEVTSLAMNSVADAVSSPLLTLVQARALDQLDQREEAADAFWTAATADRRCVEAALSRARLLRGHGDWHGAADALSEFAQHHPGGDSAGLSEVFQQLGRLLAGPLEDLEAAIDVYRRAIALDPDQLEMRASLAEFLSHRPDDWREALEHHQAVLNREPTHTASLRALLNASQRRGDPQAIATGLGIANALGIASPAEFDADADLPNPVYGQSETLDNPLWEKLRLAVNASAQEIATTLSASAPQESPVPDDPIAAFHASTLTHEGRLTLPSLLPLTDNELGELLGVIAALALDPESVQGNGKLVNAASAAFKRRSRRRLRKILEETDLDSISHVDVTAWRREVKALAQATAVDRGDIDLRTALTLLLGEGFAPAGDASTADLTPFVAASPQARALLRCAVHSWIQQL